MPITMSGCRIVELLTVHSLPADYLPSSATAVARLSEYRSSIYGPLQGSQMFISCLACPSRQKAWRRLSPRRSATRIAQAGTETHSRGH